MLNEVNFWTTGILLLILGIKETSVVPLYYTGWNKKKKKYPNSKMQWIWWNVFVPAVGKIPQNSYKLFMSRTTTK